MTRSCPVQDGSSSRVVWPDNRSFAFTIFDDTDSQTLENGKPIYDFLAACGFRTTKSVWVLPGHRPAKYSGSTCADAAYLTWVLGLQAQGFEIASHNVTYHTSTREETIRGLERFAELFGHYPESLATHVGCQEGVYAGDDRVSDVHRLIYRVLTRGRRTNFFAGHREGSPLFWGDVCREKIMYVRNFVYGDINTLKACPYMPYHDPQRPYVRYWFASSEGATVESLVKLLAPKNQDRLAAAGGACIAYTHLAAGFYRDGRLDPRFQTLMERLSEMNGWFVPVSTLLGHLLKTKGHHNLTDAERRRLELRWLLHKLRTGGTT